MKRSAILYFGFLLSWLSPAVLMAQQGYESERIQGYELNLRNIMFDSTSGTVYKVPLRNYGLSRSNYAVLLTASLAGDTNSYHIPGGLNDEDSFGFRLKPGNRNVGDTLFIIRRTGAKPILFEKISILAFRSKKRNGIMQSDKAFTEFLLTKCVRPVSAQSKSVTMYYAENQ